MNMVAAVDWCSHTLTTGFGKMVVLGLTSLCDSISVDIGPSPKEGERKEKR